MLQFPHAIDVSVDRGADSTAQVADLSTHFLDCAANLVDDLSAFPWSQFNGGDEFRSFCRQYSARLP
jgi:hypothetical protein